MKVHKDDSQKCQLGYMNSKLKVAYVSIVLKGRKKGEKNASYFIQDYNIHVLILLNANLADMVDTNSCLERGLKLPFAYFCIFLSRPLSFGRKGKGSIHLRICLSSNFYEIFFFFTVAVSLLLVLMKIAWLCFPFRCRMGVISLMRLKIF